MSGPRILAIMGSGEIAPTMAKVHRALFGRFGGESAAAVVLDTPYGFQENADDLSSRIVGFFRESVGREMAVASYRSRDVAPIESATAVARIREARYVLAGPGSPSYALRHWIGGPIPPALADKLAGGGIVTLASAAALTAGLVTVPVYEIYKVGADPSWLEGLDLLGPATGLRAAVVPHYDNAEGGNHDTRFCYLGERRLQVLEGLLPAEAFVLGVDSHTALVLDLERRTAAVFGLGGVTVRAGGRSAVFPSGSETQVEVLAEAARTLAGGGAVDAGWEVRATSGQVGGSSGRLAGGGATTGPTAAGRSLRDEASSLEGSFVAALTGGDARSAVGALLDLDAAIEARLRAGEDSPDLDGARATFRALVVRLGEAAVDGMRDPREAVDPYVTTLLELRARARAAHDWMTADLIRDRLAGAGIEVRDDPDGSHWLLGEPTAR